MRNDDGAWRSNCYSNIMFTFPSAALQEDGGGADTPVEPKPPAPADRAEQSLVPFVRWMSQKQTTAAPPDATPHAPRWVSSSSSTSTTSGVMIRSRMSWAMRSPFFTAGKIRGGQLTVRR